jgi:hypothetical protein
MNASTRLLPALLALAIGANAAEAGTAKLFATHAEVHSTYSVFFDPDVGVNTKEFALFYNTVGQRSLFHIIYQRSGPSHPLERTFGHAWSTDLVWWGVDTLAFAVDDTWWNRQHVWSPSLIEFNGRTYMFYTGVDDQDDQRIGYVSTALLDTTDTVWDSPRTMVWEAANTNWAVPDPPVYGGVTQFRDCYVMHDPEHPGALLMVFDAHDSLDAQAGRAGTVVGVARSDPGSADVWHDLGYFPSTRPTATNIPQLEGPHLFSVNGTGTHWRLMYTNAGSPPGEFGQSTVRFQTLTPGESPADTTPAHWGAQVILQQYLNGEPASFGWSGSEELRVPNADFMAGFTAWTPATGIAYARVNWSGNEFTLGAPSVTAVDDVHSARGVNLRLVDWTPVASTVTFAIDSPEALRATLEIFDAQGRRRATPFDGTLAAGRNTATWDLGSNAGARVAKGLYFARLRFAGGARSVRVPVMR